MGSAAIVRFALASLLALTSLAAPAHASMRYEPVDEFYLEGRLTWNQGTGGIAWGDAPSEDPGGPSGNWPANAIHFVSAPMPRTILLNGSRLVQLDLLIQGQVGSRSWGSSCASNRPSPDVEIFADGKPFAATQGFQSFFLNPNAWWTDDPPGFGVCRARLQAEMPQLTEGTVLTIVLTADSTTNAKLGFAAGHRSVLRLPFFGPEDVAFRYPQYAHGLAATPPGDDLTSLIAGLGLATLAVGSRRRARPGVGLVLALVFVASLAGCFGSAATSRQGETPAVSTATLAPTYQVGELAKPGLGALIGQVVATDTGQPIPGAYVAIVGRNATTTDPYGRFSFRDLPKGSYFVRVDAANYHPFEGRVEIRPDLIGNLRIDMEPLADTAGERPHVHDYWGDQKEIVVMDNVSVADRGMANGFVVAPLADGIRSVFPGTYDVEIVVRQPAGQEKYRNASLEFQANNDPSAINWTHMRQRPLGTPFHIVTSWEMQDSGHQRFSTWVFQLRGRAEYTPPVQDYFIQTVTQPPKAPFLVTVKLHKGVVPLEPPHADFWKGRSQIQVLSSPWWAAAPQIADSAQNHFTTPAYDLAWLPHHIIPPDTRWLEVNVTASRAAFPDYPWELRYRVADTGPNAQCWVSGNKSCNGPEYRRPAATSEQSGTARRWIILVGDKEADPFYARRSFWAFGLEPEKGETNQIIAIADIQTNGELRFKADVVAHRDAPPA